MKIYNHLCDDLQRYVREFIPIYERFGISKKTTRSFCDLSKKDAYYKNIRVCPRGWKKGIVCFYYRRIKNKFEWIIRPEYDNVWTICVFGQFETHKSDETVYYSIFQKISRHKIDIDDVVIDSNVCLLMIIQDPLLSNQGMVDKLTSIVVTISPEIEFLHKNITKSFFLNKNETFCNQEYYKNGMDSSTNATTTVIFSDSSVIS